MEYQWWIQNFHEGKRHPIIWPKFVKNCMEIKKFYYVDAALGMEFIILIHLRLLNNYRQLTLDLTVIQTTLDTLTDKVDDLESDISETVERTGVVEGTLLTTTSSLTGKEEIFQKVHSIAILAENTVCIPS